MNIKANLCIVVPCYNEAKNFALKEYYSFVEKHSEVLICFVNDGSTDNTLRELNKLKSSFPNRINIISYEKNRGKAEAVREGFRYCYKNYEYLNIAYLDADLATTLEECVELSTQLIGDVAFVFGSRIMKIGSTIKRTSKRFLIGRVIATFISKILGLKVYDTQCGCKIFTKELAAQLFHERFISKWLFDVELFKRMLAIYGKETALEKMIEIPLKKWIDKGDSKVKLTYFFKLWIDLIKINNAYKIK